MWCSVPTKQSSDGGIENFTGDGLRVRQRGSTAEGKSGVARDVDTDRNRLYSLGIVGPDSYCHNY